MKAAVRCNALTIAALRAQEKHGKRQDASSKSRRVRDAAPIVGGGLDLSDLLAAHTNGTKRNAAASKVALHFIVRFPPEILTDAAPGPYQGKSKEERLRLMARQAARFINEAHGARPFSLSGLTGTKPAKPLPTCSRARNTRRPRRRRKLNGPA